MKKTVFTLLVAIGAFAAKAQTHDVSLNLAPMIVNNFSGAYFYNINDELSTGGTVGYQNLKLGDDFQYSGIYIAPEARFFFNPNYENDGVFIGGYLKFRNFKSTGGTTTIIDDNGNFETINYDIVNTGFGAGVTTGWQFVHDSGFLFAVWSGVGAYFVNSYKYSDDRIDDDLFGDSGNLPGIDFRLGVSVGWRFGY